MTDKPGQHWLLLRGLCREAGHWGEFPERLQDAFPHAIVSSIDLPGTGRFYQADSPKCIQAITRQLRDQALQEGLLHRPVTLLALSLGGMVAWEWMRQYPADLAAAALINTSFAGLSPFYQRLRCQTYGQFVSLLMQKDLYQRELAIIRMVANRRDQDLDTAQAWAAIQQARPISASNALRQITAAARYRPKHEKPEIPLLLLNSLGDRLVNPACSEAIHQKLQIDMDTHPWAGHDLTLDDGDWVTNRLKHWISRMDEAG